MASLANNVIFNATSTGTGAFVPATAVTGYVLPSAAVSPAMADAKTYRYRAQNSNLTEWEEGNTVGSGTLTSFTRVVTSSSAGGTTTVNFATAPQVAITMMAADVLQFDDTMSLTAAQKAQGRANLDVLKKNYIINGAMMASQENGATAGTASAYYPVDQFIVGVANGGAFSVAQVASATPAGSPNRIRYTVTTADASVAAGDVAHISTYIEGLRTADLLFGTASAKTITVQFGVKAPAGTYCVMAINGTVNRSYVAEYVISAGEANTDVVKSVTIPGDTSGTWLATNGIGLIVRWGLMAGSTYQQAAGSWGTVNAVGSANQFNLYGTINNVFELFDVSLTEGSAAPAFQVPDYPSELYKCKRYWQKVDYHFYVGSSAAATNYQTLSISYSPMRAAPSATVASASNTNYSTATVGGTGVGSEVFIYSYAITTAYAESSGTVTLNARM